MNTCLYFGARVARRFLPLDSLPKRWREKLPGLQPNLGELNQEGIWEIYKKNAPLPPDQWLEGRSVLEIGTGRTNGSCYMMVANGARHATSLEPFRPLDPERDAKQLNEVSTAFKWGETVLSERVSRETTIGALPDEAFDMVLSLAVLEHVTDMTLLTNHLWRVLKPGGEMLHMVDYRDHFFRYPYHHLLWSEKTWSHYLDPGDLPRWRISDHISFFSNRGFSTQILKSSAINAEFAKIESRIHPSLKSRYDKRDLETAFGSIWAKKPA